MRLFSSATLVLVAALANGSPSPMALHPRLATPVGLNECDLTGTGKELAERKSVGANARGDVGKSAREWREMAARCRNFARWLDVEHRDVLLRLADEYDDRAARAEARKDSA